LFVFHSQGASVDSRGEHAEKTKFSATEIGLQTDSSEKEEESRAKTAEAERHASET
jgi:hypothetical protein